MRTHKLLPGGTRRLIFMVTLFSRPSPALVMQSPMRVLCYGDSLTAGTSPPLDDLFPYAPALEKRMGADTALVRHRGLPGATAAMMLQYADDEERGLRSLLRKTRPALAVILAGTNDLGYHAESGPIVQALCGLHELAHDLSVPTLAVGIPPSAYQAQQSEAAELANAVNRELRTWCLASGEMAQYVDQPISTWSRDDGLWAPDGLHFSPEGYRTLGEGLAGVVAERLGVKNVRLSRFCQDKAE